MAVFHILDDETDLLELLQDIIEYVGYRTKLFKSAELYLEYFNSAAFVTPIAILTDYQMDGLTGLDLIKKVRERIPCQRAVIITGSPSYKLNRLIHDSLCHLLHKPYQIKDIPPLLKALDECKRTSQTDGNCFSENCGYGIDHRCPFYQA